MLHLCKGRELKNSGIFLNHNTGGCLSWSPLWLGPELWSLKILHLFFIIVYTCGRVILYVVVPNLCGAGNRGSYENLMPDDLR